MNEPIAVSEALRLISLALEDCDKATPDKWYKGERRQRTIEISAEHRGCVATVHGPFGGIEWGHLEPNADLIVLARATMRPLLIHLRLLAQLSEEVGISHFGPEESAYPPLAALRDHYSAVRPDWRTQ